MKIRLLREWAPIVFLTLFAVFIFSPVLFGGKAFFGEEQMGFYYAISHAVAQSLESNIPFLWQGGYYGGLPTSLDQFYGNFYPFNRFLFSHFGVFFSHHLSITIATTLGLIFSYLFGRELGWRRAPAVILGILYFSATTLQWLEIGTIAAHSFMILPALLYALLYASVRRTVRAYTLAVLGGGVALAIGFLAGFMQIVFYAYCIAGAYALFLDYEHWDKAKKWVALMPVSLTYAGVTLVGLLLGLKQFFPSAHLIDLTIRTSTYATQNAYYPFIGELLPLVLPPNFQIPYLGGGGSAGFYIGPIALVFAVLGLIVYRTRTAVFFTALYCLIVAFAFHLPVFGWLNEHIPPFSRMGGNFRWMIAAAFPLAYLGASGIEGFLQNPERVTARIKKAALWSTGIIVLALTIGSIVLQYGVAFLASSPEWGMKLILLYAKKNPLHFPPEHYTNLLAQVFDKVSASFSFSNPPYFFGVMCWVLAFLFLVLYNRVKPLRLYASYALISLVTYSVIGASIFWWRSYIPQSLYIKEPALVQELISRESNSHSYRIMGFLIGDGVFDKVLRERTLTNYDMTELQLELLFNNSTLYSGIERMDGMAPYRTLRANRLLDTVLAYNSALFAFDENSPALATSELNLLYNRDVMLPATLEEKKADFIKRLSLISMMNVKYIYSLYELNTEGLALVKEFRVPAGFEDLPAYLYENKNVLPRVYFAERPTYVTGDKDTLLKTIEVSNFKNETVIECGDCEPTEGGGGAINIITYNSGDIAVETVLESPQWLVLSESSFPGWEVSIDGVSADGYTANYLFQAVLVPAGEHVVQFEYHDETAFSLFR